MFFPPCVCCSTSVRPLLPPIPLVTLQSQSHKVLKQQKSMQSAPPRSLQEDNYQSAQESHYFFPYLPPSDLWRVLLQLSHSPARVTGVLHVGVPGVVLERPPSSG